VRNLLQLAAGEEHIQLELNYQHVLLAEPLQSEVPVPKILWAIVRAISCWEIWKARCRHYMDNQSSTSKNIIRRIWNRLGIYLRLFWKRKKVKICGKKLTRNKARHQMQKEFGKSRQIWKLVQLELHTTTTPPRLASR
jgi:hypothetical protein